MCNLFPGRCHQVESGCFLFFHCCLFFSPPRRCEGSSLSCQGLVPPFKPTHQPKTVAPMSTHFFAGCGDVFYQIKNITHPSCMSVLSHPSLGSQPSLQTETLAWCFEPRYPLPVFAHSQTRLLFGKFIEKRSDVDLQIGRVLVSMTRGPH